MAQARRISACRLCTAMDLHQIIDFGAVPLGNNLQQTQSAARAAARYPLELNRCGQCGHFQLGPIRGNRRVRPFEPEHGAILKSNVGIDHEGGTRALYVIGQSSEICGCY